MRRTICKIMGAVMIMSLIWSAPSVTASDRSESQNITSVRTPINDKKGGTVWTRSFSVDGTLTYNSTPVITDDAIYLVSGNTLYELDLDGNIKRQMALAATMNSVCYMSRQENTLWIPLSGGTMQCVDINTMQSLWVSEAFGGQSLSYVTVYNGYVYAGTAEVSINSTQGTFYCLDAHTGKLQWKYRNEEQPGGYYWGGSVVMDDKLYFAGDNGILVEHDLVEDTVYREISITQKGRIRSDLQYVAAEHAIYATSNAGEICRFDGSEVTTYTMFPRAKAVNCTSTMSIVDNTAYVGAMADGMGYLCVWDMQTHSMRYTVQTGKACEVKATPLVSTAYEDGNYVYYTCNNPPGGVYFIKDTKQGTPAVQKTLYEPAAARQYCMSSIVAGSNGVLYYSNDTGTLFAVSEVEHSSDIVPSASPAVTKSPAGMSKPSTSVKPMASKTKRPKTPTKVRLIKKKNGCKISWKKGKLATRTIVYVKVGKGKWKKCASTTGKSYRYRSKTKKKVQFRLRSARKNGKRWIYSGYTKKYQYRK